MTISSSDIYTREGLLNRCPIFNFVNDRLYEKKKEEWQYTDGIASLKFLAQ